MTASALMYLTFGLHTCILTSLLWARTSKTVHISWLLLGAYLAVEITRRVLFRDGIELSLFYIYHYLFPAAAVFILCLNTFLKDRAGTNARLAALVISFLILFPLIAYLTKGSATASRFTGSVSGGLTIVMMGLCIWADTKLSRRLSWVFICALVAAVAVWILVLMFADLGN